MEYACCDISPLWVDLERAVLELAVAVDLLSNAIRARTFDNAEGAYALVRASQAKLAGVMAVFRDNQAPFPPEALMAPIQCEGMPRFWDPGNPAQHTPELWPISQPADSGHRR